MIEPTYIIENVFDPSTFVSNTAITGTVATAAGVGQGTEILKILGVAVLVIVLIGTIIYVIDESHKDRAENHLPARV